VQLLAVTVIQRKCSVPGFFCFFSINSRNEEIKNNCGIMNLKRNGRTIYIPDNNYTLGQQWFKVVMLVNGWRWRADVEPTHRSSSLKSLAGVMTMLGVPSVGWGR